MQKLLITLVLLSAITACTNTNFNNQTPAASDSIIPDTKVLYNKPVHKATVAARALKLDTAHFWKIIDYGFEKGGFDNAVKEKAILDYLTGFTPEEIQDFEIIFQQMNDIATTYGTLAAQVVMEGGSSDDSFYYFRCWLISLGKKNFYRIIENPDYLAAMDVPMSSIYRSYHCQFEELLYISDEAYKIVTKKDPSTDSTFPRDYALSRGLFYDTFTDIKGTDWKRSDLPAIVPQLYKKYARRFGQ